MRIGNSQRFRVGRITLVLYADCVRYSSALGSCIAWWLAVFTIAGIRSTTAKLYAQQTTGNVS
jgi:Na+-transporting NADH:ubiquinone oxidoreductase subunit NqrE